MKKNILATTVVFILSLLIIACTTTQQPEVGKNVDIDGEFSNIKTYNWTSDIDNIPKDQVFIGPGGIYVFNNESGRKMIKDAIQYELDSRGYKMSSANPDMLVSFLVLEQPDTLRTTLGYATLTSGERVRTEDDVTYTPVEPGTLIINLTDTDPIKQIWQGFASGILTADKMKSESNVRQAVSSIFSKFQYNNREGK